MKEQLLKSRVRQGSGKKAAHKMRAQGEIPVILYGHKEDPLSLAVPEHELWHILHNATSEHLILKLAIEGIDNGEVMTLVRDVQHHPVSGDILHVDLQRISMDEKIKVGVPVELVGTAHGVKEFGGILDHGVREVTVRCKPKEIPETLRIDVTHMEIGDSIHLSDLLEAYPLLEFLDDPHVTLAHVSPPKKVAAVEAAEVAEEGEAAEAAPEEEAEAGEGEES
ncbi:MAG: 50S ribosomal protein L25 [bacterium]|nr:MAG: 50S ribosomal protein L25 [bacterium]